MSVLWLHGNGWDELAMMGGAIAIAFLVVKLTTRGGQDEEEDAAAGAPEPGVEHSPGEQRPAGSMKRED